MSGSPTFVFLSGSSNQGRPKFSARPLMQTKCFMARPHMRPHVYVLVLDYRSPEVS